MPRSRLHAKILGQSILKRTHCRCRFNCRFTRLPWTVPIRNADVERRTVTMPSLFQKGFTLGHPKSQTVSSRSPRGSDLLCGNVRHLSTLCVDSLWHRRGRRTFPYMASKWNWWASCSFTRWSSRFSSQWNAAMMSDMNTHVPARAMKVSSTCNADGHLETVPFKRAPQ